MKRAFTYFLLMLLIFSFVAGNTASIPDSGDPAPNNSDTSEPTMGDTLKIMSYNVQTGESISVKERAPKVIATILTFSPDVIGTQEINAYWIEEMEANGFLDKYTMIGEPRDHADSHVASNEYSAIFYKTDAYNLINSGTYWLVTI